MIGAARIALRMNTTSARRTVAQSRNITNSITKVNIGMMNPSSPSSTSLLRTTNGRFGSALGNSLTVHVPIAMQSAATITTLTSSLGSKLTSTRANGIDGTELTAIDGEDDDTLRKRPSRARFSTFSNNNNNNNNNNNSSSRISSTFLRQEDDEDGTLDAFLRGPTAPATKKQGTNIASAPFGRSSAALPSAAAKPFTNGSSSIVTNKLERIPPPSTAVRTEEETGSEEDDYENDAYNDTNNSTDLKGTPIDDFVGVLSDSLRARLKNGGISSLFPVQTETVRRVLQGENLVVRSRTGSGKTLGFALPVIEKLSQSSTLAKGRNPRCLVLTPTRELANQVAEEFRRFAGKLRVTAIYGGMAMGPQIGDFRAGVDIVVATPGRLMDHLEQQTVNLQDVQIAILDEADEMLRMGFKEDVELIFESTPDTKQCMLWSATVAGWVRELAKKFLDKPQFVDMVGDHAAKLPASVNHIAYVVDNTTRDEAFVALLSKTVRSSDGGRVLVFTDTKRDAGRLAALTIPGIRLAALTGDVTQSMRERTLNDFKAGRIDVICATDVAARGLDIPSVEMVIQYRTPREEEAFVHRAGRTGRAGKKGTAVLLVGPQDFGLLRRLERDLGFSFAVRPVPTSDASNVDERDLSRIVSQVLGVPREAANVIAEAKGLQERILKRTTMEQALSNALALLVAGGNSITYKSLLRGSRGMVTVVVHPGSPNFQSLTGTKINVPAELPKGRALEAYHRDTTNALRRLFDIAGISVADRPVPYNIFITKGGLVFDLSVRIHTELIDFINEKLNASDITGNINSEATTGPSSSDAPVIQLVHELPEEIKELLASGRDQFTDFDSSPKKRRSMDNRGGRGGGNSFGRDRGSFSSSYRSSSAPPPPSRFGNASPSRRKFMNDF